jgi:hypothetical protein
MKLSYQLHLHFKAGIINKREMAQTLQYGPYKPAKMQTHVRYFVPRTRTTTLHN